MSHIPPRDPHAPLEADAVLEGTSGKAIAAMVLGYLSLAVSIFAGIPAIAIGALSLGEIKRSNGRIRGRGMAIMGIVVGSIGSVLGLVAVFVLLPAVEVAREKKARVLSEIQLGRIGLALHYYHDVNHSLPAAYTTDEDGRRLESWRVTILPYLEDLCRRDPDWPQLGEIYDQFDHEQPWNSPRNSRLISNAPYFFVSPADKSNDGSFTNVVAIVGDDTMWPPDDEVSLKQAPDGLAKTILLVSIAGTGIKWSEPRDMTVQEFLAAVRRKSGPKPHAIKGRFYIVMGDGSKREVDASLSEQQLEAMLTRAGGEAVVLP